MKKSIWTFVFFLMVFYGAILFPVCAQERGVEMNNSNDWEEIVGKVEKLDLDTSMLVVKVYSDGEQTSYQDVKISVTKEAKIVKDGQEFALKDLKAGDEISVRYIVTANGQNAAYHLWIK